MTTKGEQSRSSIRDGWFACITHAKNCGKVAA